MPDKNFTFTSLICVIVTLYNISGSELIINETLLWARYGIF